jgi:hypothetical protein
VPLLRLRNHAPRGPIGWRLLVALLAAARSAQAQNPDLSGAQAQNPDLSGAQDQPLLSRFAGSQLIGHQQREFETARFFLPSRAAGFTVRSAVDRRNAW